ncbi:bifunctional phosphopantothenoylcysteine decarboxylase/phosphopantothenate--cysteine ligase CoaBC [Acidaminococcus timonensis]|uniref:bifunctional phosphopantothenoylcysteine decarboxylase/phosphopantothenate--cysteine ligase CoaBC n=1 Tax=Acidaminococcus timonensis TaxID=1871002 RepID=UPI00248C4DA6|nr:bifunctional phosphopantothenoylcysteine decarboxylase/phosphopantothenate--cysteine ligase CoaBC [Acidaminococcus timonensis]
MLEGKKIAVGVTGGIAAYKVVTLVSRLVQAGAQVRVIMTDAATHLVSPLLFKEISGNPVATSLWAGNAEFNVEHVAIGRWCDVMVVAPATADIIGKMAGGIADDLLSTTLMACAKPKIICPAMNTNMLENPATVRNLETLRRDGVTIMPSGAGHLACGVNGSGRLPEPEDIKAFIDAFLARREGDLRGLRILVTAGGTREAIDPVRFIGNRSSGKMGYAIARDAARRGAEVTLVSGPTALRPPRNVAFTSVESTREMLDAVLGVYPNVDVVIMAAAVADYKPHHRAEQKIKKNDETLELSLDKNPDILKLLGQQKAGQLLVGFAAETQNLLENAAAKVKKKNLDMIVANDVTMKGAGFSTDTNVVKLLFPDGTIKGLDLMSKEEVGNHILDIVKEKTSRH